MSQTLKVSPATLAYLANMIVTLNVSGTVTVVSLNGNVVTLG